MRGLIKFETENSGVLKLDVRTERLFCFRSMGISLLDRKIIGLSRDIRGGLNYDEICHELFESTMIPQIEDEVSKIAETVKKHTKILSETAYEQKQALSSGNVRPSTGII